MQSMHRRDVPCEGCTVQQTHHAKGATCKGMLHAKGPCAKAELCRGILHAKGRPKQRDAPCKRTHHAKHALHPGCSTQRVRRATTTSRKECNVQKDAPRKGILCAKNFSERRLHHAQSKNPALCTGATQAPHEGSCARRGPTWVHGVGGHLGALQARGQLAGMQHVGQLAVAVALEGGQGAGGRAAQRGGVQAAGAVRGGGDDDHAAGSAALQPLQEQLGEQEVAQVVDLEGEAEAVLRRPPGAHPCGGAAGSGDGAGGWGNLGMVLGGGGVPVQPGAHRRC